MKNSFLLLFVFVALAIGCSKEETNEIVPVQENSKSLKCGSDTLVNYYIPYKWRMAKEMIKNIHWIEQACFRIEAFKCKIYTDPLAIQQNDYANLILISHNHGDHFSPDDISKLAGPKTIIIAPEDCNYTGPGKKFTLKPGEQFFVNRWVKIKAVHAYNITKTQFHPVSNNWVGYLITINGVTIYHAGDTERIPEMKNMRCDIALLPLGQTYTMNSVSDAAESAKDVKAMFAIPMHYGLYEGTEEDAQSFKDLLNGYITVVIKNKGE